MDDQVVVIGHRGFGSGEVAGVAENTVESFAAALAAGAGWVETDVRACQGGLIVAHDHTTADGRPFADLTLAQCRRLGVLSLDELLDWLPPAAGLNLEIKTSLADAGRSHTETTAAAVGRRVDREADGRPLLVSSFDPSALLIVRDAAPSVRVGLLGWIGFPLRTLVPAAVHLGCSAVVASAFSFGANLFDGPAHPDPRAALDVAHEAGLDVIAWCPAVDDVVELAGLGVDGLIVDDVPGTVAVLAGLAD